jgi:hypothetical protein
MAMTTLTTPVTSRSSFSFYVPANAAKIADVADVADATCVRGVLGPKVVRAMRAEGWNGVALFDGVAYEQKVDRLDDARWFDEQATAGADRLLTQGSWIPWDPTGGALREAVEQEMHACVGALGATPLFAIEYRWLTRGLTALIDEFAAIENPIAVVLAHARDPLSASGAVDALVMLAARCSSLSILRGDHGAVGALAFGADHASMGLTTTYRHFVPVGVRASGKPGDRTQRVFVWEMMDWFTVANIAGWSTTAISPTCPFACCDGEPLLRFFDPALAEVAAVHNRTLLSVLAEDILDAPRTDRARRFASRCAAAVALYGPMGKFSNVTEAKDQLVQWASYA